MLLRYDPILIVNFIFELENFLHNGTHLRIESHGSWFPIPYTLHTRYNLLLTLGLLQVLGHNTQTLGLQMDFSRGMTHRWLLQGM